MTTPDLVTGTRDPAFAVDLRGSIVAWNESAERLLGHGRCDVLGRSCWEVVQGRDVFGNRYCGEHCPLRDNALGGEPLRRGQITFRARDGEQVQVSSGCMVLNGGSESGARLIHILKAVEGRERIATADPTDAPSRQLEAKRAGLSGRQHEVLQLLARGEGTRGISQLLGITVSTTRNHIRGILTRLEVHSRLEATVLARRLGIV